MVSIRTRARWTALGAALTSILTLTLTAAVAGASAAPASGPTSLSVSGSVVYGWGRNDQGSVGNGTVSDGSHPQTTPVPVTDLATNVAQVTGGANFGVALHS